MSEPIQVGVLDAWPLIETYTRGQQLSAVLERLLDSSRIRPKISTVNFAEVCYTLARHAGTARAAREVRFLRKFLDIEAPDEATAEAAGWIKYAYSVSLADSFAAATSLKHNADLWTGDPELLCSDRVWSVHDMRVPQDRVPAVPGRRPSISHLSKHQLASLIIGPLRTRRTTTPDSSTIPATGID